MRSAASRIRASVALAVALVVAELERAPRATSAEPPRASPRTRRGSAMPQTARTRRGGSVAASIGAPRLVAQARRSDARVEDRRAAGRAARVCRAPPRGGAPRSTRVKTIASARRSAATGSRSRPRGGSRRRRRGPARRGGAGSTSRRTARCWNPSSRRSRSAPRSAAAPGGVGAPLARRRRSRPASARASATGSSPPSSAETSGPSPAQTTTTPREPPPVAARQDRRAAAPRSGSAGRGTRRTASCPFRPS